MMATTVKKEIQFVMPVPLVTIAPQVMKPYHAQWDITLDMEYRNVLYALQGGHALASSDLSTANCLSTWTTH